MSIKFNVDGNGDLVIGMQVLFCIVDAFKKECRVSLKLFALKSLN